MKPVVRYKCLLSILLLCSSAAYTQNNGIDSLKRVLQTQKADTSKVKLLTNLSYAYAFSYADTGAFYGELAFELAENLKYDSGVLWSIVPLSASLSNAGNYPLSPSFCFKALEPAKKKNDIVKKIFCKWPIGRYLL